jgi:hypothetical protein
MSQTLDSKIAVIGIDIGKNSFHIVGQDRRGALVPREPSPSLRTKLYTSKKGIVRHSKLDRPTSGWGQKRRPSQPRHVSFRRLRTLVRASIRWSSRPTLLSAPRAWP